MVLDEAYILVKHVGLDFPSIKKMPRYERNRFLERHKEEVEAQNKALES